MARQLAESGSPQACTSCNTGLGRGVRGLPGPGPGWLPTDTRQGGCQPPHSLHCGLDHFGAQLVGLAQLQAQNRSVRAAMGRGAALGSLLRATHLGREPLGDCRTDHLPLPPARLGDGVVRRQKSMRVGPATGPATASTRTWVGVRACCAALQRGTPCATPEQPMSIIELRWRGHALRTVRHALIAPNKCSAMAWWGALRERGRERAHREW